MGTREQSPGPSGRAPSEPGPDVSDDLNNQAQGQKAEREKGKPVTESTFDDYEPHYVFEGAQKHPATLAESAAMASVNPPPLDYQPNLPKKVISTGRLSGAQLENIAYAGQAHAQMLPGGETRRGYFIGDGTGVGKGAQIAGIILDNWRQGRRKAVWVSENQRLRKDAGRDLDWVGLGKRSLVKVPKANEPIAGEEGIVFTTYKTLTMASKDVRDTHGNIIEPAKKRIDQLAEWLGEDFDGVIAFDEAHNMRSGIQLDEGAGSGGRRRRSKVSDIARAGIELQNRLPKARVVYASATGATEVKNLAYAVRLGLWGEGTPFPDQATFISKVSAGGVAAMEVIAKDMKAMGLYQARSISYNGVQYGTVTHSLTPEQQEIYNELARAWQLIFNNIEQALEETGADQDARAKAQARSQFYSSQLRFFEQVIIGMQMPSAFADMDAELAKGNSLVMQLTSTNEAVMERRMEQAAEDGLSLDEVDLSPKDIVMQYLARAFPTTLYEEVYNSETQSSEMRPVLDAQGNPVQSPEAIARRDRLLEQLATLRVPEGALDQILHHFGYEAVAEITGRSQRIVYDPDTREARLQRRGEAALEADAGDFDEGRKRILVFSDAGGTGRSYHADLRVANQQKRIHYLVQPGWRADKAVQGFGRTHRTNQKQPPEYRLLTTDIVAHKRFISSIARRLDQLGALTRGQRETTSQGIFSADANLENQYGTAALNQFMEDMYSNTLPEEIGDANALATELGLGALANPDGSRRDIDLTIPRFLNRILSLELGRMTVVFDNFYQRLVRNIEYARSEGTFDVGMETITGERVTKVEDVPLITHPTGGETRYVKLEVENPYEPIEFTTFTRSDLESRRLSFYVNNQSGRIYAFEDVGQVTDPVTGEIGQKVKRTGASGYVYFNLTSKTIPEVRARYTELNKDRDMEDIRRRWKADVDNTPKTKVETLHLITGALLPVWDRLPLDQPRIMRTATDEGERILGRLIPPTRIRDTLRRLGHAPDMPQYTPAQMIEAIMERNVQIVLSNNWQLRRVRVMGNERVEIVAPAPGLQRPDIELLRTQGGIVEVINYRARVFIPTGSLGTPVLTRILEGRQVIDVIDPERETENEDRADQGGPHTREAFAESRPRASIGMSRLKAVVNRFRKQFQGAQRVRVEIYDTQAEFEGLASGEARAAGKRLRGAFDAERGVIVLIRENLRDATEALKVIRHELFGHYGFDLLPKAQREALVKAIQGMRGRGGKVGETWATVERLYRHRDASAQAEEVFARLAEDPPGRLAASWNRVLAVLARVLRQLGLVRAPITTPELRTLAEDIAAGFRKVRPATVRPVTRGAQDLRFSLEDGPVTLDAINERITRMHAHTPLWARVRDRILTLPGQTRRGWLGALTRQQVIDLAQAVYGELAKAHLRVAQRMESEKVAYMEKPSQIAERWQSLIGSDRWRGANVSTRLADLMYDATLLGVDPSNPKHADRPEYEALNARYRRLPTEARTLFVEVRETYSKRYHDFYEALKERINRAQFADSTKARLQDQLRTHYEVARQRVYFPLKRFGDFWIDVTGDNGQREAFYMFETEAEWTRALAELRRNGYRKEQLTSGKKIDDQVRARHARDSEFLRLALSQIDQAGLDPDLAAELKDNLYQMYLQTLPEASVRKAFLHRKGTAGFNRDALRAFAYQSFHGAHQLAKLKHSDILAYQLKEMEALISARDESGDQRSPEDQAKMADIAGELRRRFEWAMNPTNARWTSTATSFGFAWYLGITPGAALVNLTQQAIVTYPLLSVRYGKRAAFAALSRANRDYTGALTSKKLRARLETEFGGDMREALRELEAGGAIDRTLAHSLAGVSEFDYSLHHPLWAKGMKTAAFLFHHAERMNREATAIATYRLERTRLERQGVMRELAHARAVEAARNAIYESHFDYSNANRARFMQSNTAKVLLLFRQYSQNMTYLLARQAYLWAKGETPEIKREARGKLLGILGMTALFAGSLGLPLADVLIQGMNLIGNGLGDDDEPLDAELAYRNLLNEYLGPMGGGVFARGLINQLGGDLASRTSLSELWLRSPDRELETRDIGGYWLEQVAGPLAAIPINFWRGLDIMQQGQMQRGLETMAPKALKDFSRAQRYGTEGVTTLRGDPLIENPAGWQLLLQAVGITPAELAERYDENNAVKRLETKLVNRRRALIDEFAMAVRIGDEDRRSEVLTAIQGWNAAHPAAAISGDSLTRSLRARARRTTETEGGIYLDRRLRQEIEDRRFLQ